MVKRKANETTSNSKKTKKETTEENEKENLNKSFEEEENDDCEEKAEDKSADKKSDEDASEKTVEKNTDAENTEAKNLKDSNLKIISWNINGIRAWLEHGGLDAVKKENPDIFCCQETKCDKSKIPIKAGIPNYHSYWLSGDKQGYSGVGLLSRVKPIKVTYGIEDKKFDNEGRVITAEYENYYVINSYIPNSSRGLVRLGFRQEWEVAFLKYLKSLDAKKPVIWCGDLNVAHNKIDLKNPDTNTKTAGFTKEERECFSKVLSEGFIDSFRHLYPTKEHCYTYWSYFHGAREKNVGWRLDYFVLSDRIKSNLIESTMYPHFKGSDHCPVVLYMKF